MPAPCYCSVIPPHMLDHMIRQGNDPALQQAALNTVRQTARLMGLREANERRPLGPEELVGLEYRQVFNCGGTEWLPGRLVLTEGGTRPAQGAAINEAYQGADHVYRFYSQFFGRNSIDGRGMRLIASTSYSRRYMNAFWNGRQMVYGDGDGILFGRFTASLDVIGHEMTHGVTQYTAQLVYQDQPGALNESVSDCFGSMVKQFALNQTADQADWLIGKELLAPGVQGRALRDMAHPGTAYDDPRLGKDPQPVDMNGYVRTGEDSGGVHLNSSIPNHAFYLASKAAGGHSWETMGQAWYRTLLSLHNPQATFRDFAAATLRCATELWGAGHKNVAVLKDAWSQVKVI